VEQDLAAPALNGAEASAPRRGGLIAAARLEDAAAALAARHGTAGNQPALRRDLVFRRQVQMGEVRWVVKDPVAASYYFFEESQWALIRLFDGTRTAEEIHRDYQALFASETIERSLVAEYEEMLRGMNFIEKSAAEKNLALLASSRSARKRAADEKAEGFNPFFILFHVVDPHTFLRRTLKYVRWLWSPPVVAAALVFFLWTLGVIVVHWSEVWSGTKVVYALGQKPFLEIIQFILIITFIGAFHESSHGYVCEMYGGEVHDIGIALVYATPAFYCNTTDSLLFENRWDELWVTLAGIYIEAWICSLATVFWVVSYPDTVLHDFAFKTMLYTGVSTIFLNINPLIKIDGYYALTTLVQISELREESFRYVGAAFQKYVLRLPVEVPVVSRRKRRIYWIYGVLALSWIVVIMRFIGGVFYNLYNHYFPNWAVVLLIATLYFIFRKRVRLLTRTLRLLYLDKKELIMSAKFRRPLVAAAVVLAILLFVPWSRRKLDAPATLRPMRAVRLEVPEDAVVARVLAREGERVEAGQPILQLISPESAEERVRLASERERMRAELARGREDAEASRVFQSETRGASIDAALRSGRAREERLVVRSPIAGRVLTPRLDDLEGRAVLDGALLAEVGADRTLAADLAVSERLFDDLEPNAPVSALFRGHPAPVRGRIVSLAPAALAQPATASTSTDPAAPHEHPEQFAAVAVFDNADGSLVAGMAGNAKILGRRASYASRAWRVVKRWAQSTIW
jgi:putative peptide zinc metalloprotease protein